MRPLFFSLIFLFVFGRCYAEAPSCWRLLRAYGLYLFENGETLSVQAVHRVSPVLLEVRKSPEYESVWRPLLQKYVQNDGRLSEEDAQRLYALFRENDLVENDRLSPETFRVIKGLLNEEDLEEFLPGCTELYKDCRNSQLDQWGRYFVEVKKVHVQISQILKKYGYALDQSALDPQRFRFNKSFSLALDVQSGQLEHDGSLGLLFAGGFPIGLFTSWGYVPLLIVTGKENVAPPEGLEKEISGIIGLRKVPTPNLKHEDASHNLNLGPLYQVTRNQTGHRFQEGFSLRASSKYFEPHGRAFEWQFLPLPQPWRSPD